MNRRGLLICLISAVAAFPAAAAVVPDSIVAQLRAQGFTSFDVSTTLLGRVRILASSQTMRREIVLNPGTGEVLRDYQESISLGDEAYATVSGTKDAAATDATGSASGGASGSGTTGSTGSSTAGGGSGSHSRDESEQHDSEDHHSSEEDHGENDDE